MQPDKTLARLSDLDDYEVALDQPDVTGWNVKTTDNQECGRVEDLIVDTGTMQVVYLDVKLYDTSPASNEDSHVLIPLAEARLDDHVDRVLLSTWTGTHIASLPPFTVGAMAVMEPEALPATRNADARRFYGARGGRGDVVVRRSTLSESQRIPGDGQHTPK